MIPNFAKLKNLIFTEFADIVAQVKQIDGKSRVLCIDGSYLDFWWSEVDPERFAYHWDRLHVDGKIYRHDNSPHRKWKYVSTFPQHFHKGSEDNVVESYLPSDPQEAVRTFLTFCRSIIQRK